MSLAFLCEFFRITDLVEFVEDLANFCEEAFADLLCLVCFEPFRACEDEAFGDEIAEALSAWS